MDVTRLAMPLFGDEVAPRFCFAERFLVADLAGSSVATTQRLSMGDASWPRRLAELAAAGVTVLLCGGFNRRFLPLAASHQIEVIWGLVGPADRVLQAYCAGQLESFRLRSEGSRSAKRPWSQSAQPGRRRRSEDGRGGGRRGREGHGPGSHRR